MSYDNLLRMMATAVSCDLGFPLGSKRSTTAVVRGIHQRIFDVSPRLGSTCGFTRERVGVVLGRKGGGWVTLGDGFMG